MRLDLIKPYPKNAKKHPEKQIRHIADSIKAFGFNQPLVLDNNNVIIVGHGRYEAAKLLGMVEVPAIKVSLSPKQASAYRLADNKLNESDWDMELVIEELKNLPQTLLDLTTFSRDLIIELDEKDDKAPPLPKNNPKTKKGDIYQLGKHRVMCGDSTNLEDVKTLMEGKSADMVFTDPPYGVKYQSNMRTETPKFDVLENDDKILTDWIPHISIFSTGFIFIWTTWKVLDQWLKPVSQIGEVSNMIVWHKGGGGIGDLRHTFSTDYEMALVLNRGASITGRRIGSVWRLKKDHAGQYAHPTQKPVELALEAITKTTHENDLVLDFFLGSGTTLIATEKSKRICYGMEIDPKYVDVIVKRYEDYTGKKAKKEG